MIMALIVSVLLALPVQQIPIPTFEPIPSPTPMPTATPLDLEGVDLPLDDIYGGLATVAANLNSMPDDLSNPGVAVLPNEDGTQLYSYAKWLLSANSAQDVFGSFSPLVIHIGAVITIVIFLAIIYLSIFVVAYILRFVIWIIARVIDVIDAIPFIG